MSPTATVLLRQLRDVAEKYYLETYGRDDLSHEVGHLPKPIEYMLDVCKNAGISKSVADEVVQSTLVRVTEQHENDNRLRQLRS